jgi:rhodanese-related sulfurtransferase
MKRIISRTICLILAIMMSVAVVGCGGTSDNGNVDAGTSNNQRNTYRSITMDEAVNMMAQETGYIILDVRRPDEFAAGHIPNAINVPNETIGTAEISELPDKNQLIMVYCRSGRRSKEASEKLVKLGYTNIVEFGGILDWKGEIVTD